MSIIMLINLKGGVAKTTTAVAIAECLASQGHRTLLIDADHQCISGELLLGEARQEKCETSKRTLHDLLAAMLDGEVALSQFEKYVARKASNISGGLPELSVLPCSIRLDDFSTNMAKAKKGYHSNEEFLGVLATRRKQLRRWVESNFDFAIVDCPPSLAIQVRFLLSVADGYIVPCVPDRLSVRGSLYLSERIKSHGYRLPGLGTLWSMRRGIAMHHRIIEATGQGCEPFARLPRSFKTIIPHANKIIEAQEPGGQPKTFRQKYTLEFAKLFEELCGEVVQRAELQRKQQPAPQL